MSNKRIHFNISERNFHLLLSTLFSCGMVAGRIYKSLTPEYLFLIWNLFLAWIPYIISYILRKKNNDLKRKITLLGGIILWLLFYPNASYIITDLFHLYEKDGIPLWYDLILIVSFAWNGMILALLSLQDIQFIIASRTSNSKSWIYSILFLFLTGFGVYIGRYLRWNSWDVFSQSRLLFSDLWGIATKPFENTRAYMFTFVFSAFQVLIYYYFMRLRKIIIRDEGNS